MVEWHKKSLLDRMYINIGDGKKAAMPRYYKDKIYSHAERSEIAGYQKGELEKQLLEDIKRYSGNASFARDKRMAVKAAFDRMKYQSSNRQKL